MPYVHFHQRQILNPIVDALLKEIKEFPEAEQGGAFNYVVFLTLRCLTENKRYGVQRGFVGDLVWALLEWYRRFAVPYEDDARMRNGDIV